MGEIAQYTYAEIADMHLMAVNVIHVACTNHTFHIVTFQTETIFLPLKDGLAKVVHLMCSHMTMSDQEEC